MFVLVECFILENNWMLCCCFSVWIPVCTVLNSVDVPFSGIRHGRVQTARADVSYFTQQLFIIHIVLWFSWRETPKTISKPIMVCWWWVQDHWTSQQLHSSGYGTSLKPEWGCCVVWQQILLYLLSDGSRVNRLWLGGCSVLVSFRRCACMS